MLSAAVSVITTLLTLAGLGFCCAALWAARSFSRAVLRTDLPLFTPPVSILKPLKGVDASLYEALASHCSQDYPAPFEILFGLSSLTDPASAVIDQLRADYPARELRTIHCPELLGRKWQGQQPRTDAAACAL